MRHWTTVSLRKELVKEIQKILRTGRYTSISEFVSEAVRLRIEEVSLSRSYVSLLLRDEQILYTQKHTWAKIDLEGNVKVGLSDYAGKQLKTIVHVQTGAVGQEVTQKEPFGILETTSKFMFVLNAPVSGKIREVNKRVMDEPYIINEDPYESGWIAKIEPTNLKGEIKELLDSREYEKWVKKLRGRLCPRRG